MFSFSFKRGRQIRTLFIPLYSSDLSLIFKIFIYLFFLLLKDVPRLCNRSNLCEGLQTPTYRLDPLPDNCYQVCSGGALLSNMKWPVLGLWLCRASFWAASSARQSGHRASWGSWQTEVAAWHDALNNHGIKMSVLKVQIFRVQFYPPFSHWRSCNAAPCYGTKTFLILRRPPWLPTPRSDTNAIGMAASVLAS